MYVRLGRVGYHLPVSTLPPPELTFDEMVATFAVNLVSYWKFATVIGGATPDEQGVTHTATVNGSPELNVETIVTNDTVADGAPVEGKCIAWPGTTPEYAQVGFHANHKTADGTIVVYFQRDSGAAQSTLVMSDVDGTAGGFAISVMTDGSFEAHLRGSTGTPVTLTSPAGSVLPNRAYAIVFRWGGTAGQGLGLEMYDDTGALVGVRLGSASILTGLGGTSPIRFGITHTATNPHKGPFGRVIWLNRRVTNAEAATLGGMARTIERSATDSYRALELSMGPVGLWGLGETSGTVFGDVVAGRNATLDPGSVVAYGVPALPGSQTEKAIDFQGTGSASVPHAPAFVLANYTLSFWFKPNIIPADGEPALPLILKEGPSGTSGNFACYLASNNGDVLRVRLTAGTIIDINTPNDTIQANTSYHVCIRGNNTGVDLHLDGRFIAKTTVHTIGWSTNTQPLRFAASPFFTAVGDCILDEVCLFNRVVSGSELAALAQRTAPPVAVAGGAGVIESTPNQPIDVLENDSFVGIPTINLVAPLVPAPHSAAVVAAANTLPYINFSAGAVGAGGAVVTLNYNITDANGTSNTGASQVTIQDSNFVPTSIANCYTRAGGTTPVGTMLALQNAINAAPTTGAQITIANGTYAGSTLTLDPHGTEAGPIVVRPAGARGDVVINDATWTISPGSTRLVIENIHFNNAQINVNGSHHRIARCQFRDIGRYCIRLFTAADTRISHCDFTGYQSDTSAHKGCVQLDSVSLRNSAIQRLLVDYCHMHDIVSNRQVDPANVLQIGTAGGSWNKKCGIILDHVLIDHVRSYADGEFICCKTSEVTFRYCTFTDMVGGGPLVPPYPGRPSAVYSQQYLQQRQGSGIEVRSCWMGVPLYVFDDLNVPAPVRNPLIIGNRFTGTHNLVCQAGNDRPGQAGGGTDTYQGPYHHCTNGRFVGNVVQDGRIIVGDNPANPAEPPGTPNFYAAEDNNFVDSGPRINSRLAGGSPYVMQNEVGTTFNDDTAADYGDAARPATAPPSFTAAVQLTVGSGAGQVGMTAPDPLCPTGPQS